MKIIRILLVLLSWGMMANGQGGAVIKLSPTFGGDARIDSRSTHANLNFGSESSIGLWAWTLSGGLSVSRTLLSFPISQIPKNAIIQYVNLKLFYDSTSVYTMGQTGVNSFILRRIIGQWNEDSVTWNNQPAVTNLNQTNYFFSVDNDNPNIELGITNLFNAARDANLNNLDLLLQLNFETIFRSLVFASSEHQDSTKRPTLVITYGLPRVTLVRPTLLDSHEVNKPLSIEWNSAGVSHVAIDYTLNNQQWINIASNIPSQSVNNLYLWTPTFTTPYCKIRVRKNDDSTVFGISSKAFKIYDGPIINLPRFKITSPKVAGNFWVAGSTQKIRWEVANSNYTRLYYAQEGSGWQILKDSIYQDSSFFWQIPIQFTGKIRFRVTDPIISVFGDTTPFYVTIIPAVIADTPKVKLLFPKGGESFEANKEITILWEAQSIDSFLVQLKTTGTWSNISNYLPSSLREFRYLLPNVQEPVNFIRVIGYKDNLTKIDSTKLAFGIFQPNGINGINQSIVSIFPNPVSGSSVTMNWGPSIQTQKILSIYSYSGDLLWKGEVDSNKQLSVSDLKNGIYLFMLEDPKDNSNRLVQRIIINR